MLHLILQIGSAITDSAASPVATGIQTAAENLEITETKISLIEMILKGGPIMYPIALLLLISIYLLVERLLIISKASKKNDTLLLSLKELIHNGDIGKARTLCKTVNTPESTMIEQGVSRIGKPIEEIREALNKSGANEITKLEKNMNVLSIIGRIAPMFGFVGTIIGVITIFRKISQSGTVEIVQISDGLYQKMVSSAGGLVVGVIAFIFYYWLNARIDKLAHRMEETQIKFLDMLNEPSN
jgi:biopolymer transport protein ExbB